MRAADINDAFRRLMVRRTTTLPGPTAEVDWDGFFAGTCSARFIPIAIRELHLRLLALEGRDDEAKRLIAIMDEANKDR